MTWQQPFHDHSPRYDTWELALCDLMLFGLPSVVGFSPPGLGETLMHGLVHTWSITVTGAPWYGFSFVSTQAFPLLACTIFAAGMHRIALHRSAERERADSEARENVHDTELEAELRVVRDLAGPTLEQIAEGNGPDPAAARSLEAALRDLIRGGTSSPSRSSPR